MKMKNNGLSITAMSCVAFSLMVIANIDHASAAQATVGLRVFPAEVNLETARDRQSIVAQFTRGDGVTLDVTAQCSFTFKDASKARAEKNIVLPIADGETELVVAYNGQQVILPVKVTEATVTKPLSFELDIMPVFMAAGCNTGACHGAARGKDGFMLSLFGYDPNGDYNRLLRELPGRRVNLALPEDSLLLTKVTNKVTHTGGKLMEEESEYYATLLEWIEAGAKKDGNELPHPVSVEIMPDRIVLEGEGATQQMTVRATYSDGTDRDVTHLAVFMSNNDNSATVTKSGMVTASKRGEAFIMARFETHTVGTHAIVIPKGVAYEDPKTPENNYIDTLINNKLRKMRIVPSEVCSDEVFIRRVYLDITGTLPTPEEFERFMAEPSPTKREMLVDELLGRKEFVEMWVMKWAELLKIRADDGQGMSYKATLLYYNWLQDRIARDVPFNEVVQELLSANGGTFGNPATNYYQVERDTLKLAENTAQVFMGMRLQCAQCHNHPFDRWTMNDYYGFAAFFAQIGRKRGEDPRETIVFDRGGGGVNHPVTKQDVTPKFLGGIEPDVKRGDRRTMLAQWLASNENPYFASNLSNIMWAHFFGRGIIDQVDDVRVSNPPVNKDLLDELAKRLTEYNYDFKRLIRDICTSRTYQLSTQSNETNATDSTNFSKGTIRRMRAEVMLDAITQVTDTRNKFRGLPLGARAVQIADGRTSTYFLTTFGRATRETVCSCEVVMEPNLSQALHLLNGDTVNNRIREGNVIKKMLDEGKDPQSVIDSLYIRALSRRPTEKELGTLLPLIEASQDKQGALEDVFWSLLNSKEFMFNH